jgi:ABC-type thiamine transport system ATPase subunit
MTMTAADLRSKVDRVTGLRDGLRARAESARAEVLRLEQEEIVLSQVAAFMQLMIDQEVTIGVKAVEQLMTEGLQTVFADQDLRVRSTVEVQRGKVSVDLLTVQKHGPHEVEGSPEDAFGGALMTMQSILLRVIIILRRGLRPLLLGDETLPAINHEYLTTTGRFLSSLCKRLGMDILLVTHNPALEEVADHVYRFVPRNGAVTVEVSR